MHIQSSRFAFLNAKYTNLGFCNGIVSCISFNISFTDFHDKHLILFVTLLLNSDSVKSFIHFQRTKAFSLEKTEY